MTTEKSAPKSRPSVKHTLITCCTMFGNGFHSDYVQKLKTEDSEYSDSAIKQKERKLAVYGLCLSLSIICAKVLHANRSALHGLLFEDKLFSYETVEANGQVMLHYARTTIWRSGNIIFPLVCGLLMTAFTWLMVYLDSSVPGEQPPTPLSPNKYKKLSGHTFHLGYMIAIVNGLLVFTLMLVSGISINII